MNSCSILQLNPSIPVMTPDGRGEAIGWMDYGKNDELFWIVLLRATGECWAYANAVIRACPNAMFEQASEFSTGDLGKSSTASPASGLGESVTQTASFIEPPPPSGVLASDGNAMRAMPERRPP